MKSFNNVEEGRQQITELLDAHKRYILQNMTPVDSDVANQSTRLGKFFCWFIYGHLLDKEGICRRCGKAFRQKKVYIPEGKLIEGTMKSNVK